MKLGLPIASRVEPANNSDRKAGYRAGDTDLLRRPLVATLARRVISLPSPLPGSYGSSVMRTATGPDVAGLPSSSEGQTDPARPADQRQHDKSAENKTGCRQRPA